MSDKVKVILTIVGSVMVAAGTAVLLVGGGSLESASVVVGLAGGVVTAVLALIAVFKKS